MPLLICFAESLPDKINRSIYSFNNPNLINNKNGHSKKATNAFFLSIEEF